MISKIREVLQKHKEAIPVAAMAEILSVMDEVEANNKWIPCGQTWPYPGERVQVTYKIRLERLVLHQNEESLKDFGLWQKDAEEI